MSYPPFVSYREIEQYRQHYEKCLCKSDVQTFDGYRVRFRKRDFYHAFFESRKGGKDNWFSLKRAERIDWIKAALQDPHAERYLGWNRIKKRYERKRRVTVVKGNYVVIIQLKKKKEADFVTAYVADTPGRPGRPSTLEQIRKSPRWS